MGDVDVVALHEHASASVDRVAPKEQNALCAKDYISTKFELWDCHSEPVRAASTTTQGKCLSLSKV